MRRALILCCLALAAAPRPAAAEWQLSPMIGLTLKGLSNATFIGGAPSKTSIDFGGAVSLLGGGILGVEGVTVFTPHFNDEDQTQVIKSSRTFALMGNVVLTTPRKWTEYSLRPFVSGGAGVMRLSVTDVGINGTPVSPVRSTAAGFDVGGGAIGFLSKNTGLRFDFRYYSTFTRQQEAQIPVGEQPHVSYLTLSVGVVFRR